MSMSVGDVIVSTLDKKVKGNQIHILLQPSHNKVKKSYIALILNQKV